MRSRRRAHAEKYVQDVHYALGNVPSILRGVAELPCVDIFGLNDEMLDRANELALAGMALKPFDHAILAGVLVSSSKLWQRGERRISFAESDSDLQPWGKKGEPREDLRKLYEEAHLWVYGDFTLQFPPRPAGYE